MNDPGSEPIRVFLVDDQDLVRAGFRMLIDSQPDLSVVGEAGDGGQALERLAVTRCDVVLMDVRMPRLDGVEATRILLERPDPPQVIVLTTFDLDEYAFAAIRAGAAAFLLKDATPETLLDAIRTVHAGDSVVAPSTTRRLLEHFAGALPDLAPAGADDRLATLTDRERETLVLVGRGLTNAEIAADFVVSEATVKTHIGRLLAKTASRDRVQLVVLAYESGLVGS
ncbi:MULTISPECIES: response regulator transcription factor [unclassified Nocardioides]|uniref:response regulator transcription factor n=1 Tax=unclassified Nocardioides TaxID=2615069 RepID=UPI0011710A82|nr:MULTISPECIES: response regulator transcription factor [unclassified Nocardioides]TQK73226.1 LuxR family two component transcriptional regulator [Nocardioides sp. SLBN-35]WGY02537.1 response regulator transcription factor [Nocardioides sp. QY071]